MTYRVYEKKITLLFIFLALFAVVGVTLIALRLGLTLSLLLAALVASVVCFIYYRFSMYRPVLVIDERGIWTRMLGQVCWPQIREVRIDRVRPLKSPAPNTYLVIVTQHGTTDKLDALYLNESVTLLHAACLKYMESTPTLYGK